MVVVDYKAKAKDGGGRPEEGQGRSKEELSRGLWASAGPCEGKRPFLRLKRVWILMLSVSDTAKETLLTKADEHTACQYFDGRTLNDGPCVLVSHIH